MSNIEQAAALIQKYWNSGDTIDYKKSDPWPETVEQGYAVQAELAKLVGEPIVGWKIAATAVAGRSHINVDRPLAGRLFAPMCHNDGVVLPLGKNRMTVAEVEFVFTLNKDLPAREADYTRDEIAASIKSLHPGLEIPDSRFADFTLPGTAGLIADNACAAHFILGEPTEIEFDPQALANHPTSLVINGEVATSGLGGDALDGPLNALVWIANTLSKLRVGLKAGQFVTTGVTGKPTQIKRGDIVCADLGVFGSVTASLV